MESATSNDPPVGSEGTCREYISSWDALEAKSAAEEVGGHMVLAHGHSSKPALSHFSRSLARFSSLLLLPLHVASLIYRSCYSLLTPVAHICRIAWSQVTPLVPEHRGVVDVESSDEESGAAEPSMGTGVV